MRFVKKLRLENKEETWEFKTLQVYFRVYFVDNLN